MLCIGYMQHCLPVGEISTEHALRETHKKYNASRTIAY
jgi:hypothetical protein